MKKHFLLPAVLLLGFTTAVTSCKKKKDDDVNPTNPTPQACTVDRARTNSDSTQATYDSNNRIIKYQTFNNSGNSDNFILYTYNSNSIVQKNYDNNGDLTAETDYYLNSNSNVSYSVHIEDGDTDNADTTWYSYDGSNHNIRRATKNTSAVIGDLKNTTYDTTWYTYSGDNLSKIDKRNDNGDMETTIYSYGTADAKSKFLVPGQDAGILGLFGNTSAKLPVSATSGSTTRSYFYQFNQEGYVTRYQIVNSAVTEKDIRYTYNCK